MSPRRVLRRAATVTLCGVLPALLTLSLVALVVEAGRHHQSDFATFWASGRDVLHGRSPYPALASLPRHADPQTFAPFVYPPVAAISMVPLSLLPLGSAGLVFLLLDLAALGLALRLLGVADWRCYGLAYGSAPLFAGAGLGTVSPLLLLGVAAAWRYRHRAATVGLAVAWVVTAKLFLWPLWLWLVRTRRFRAAAIAAAAAAAGVAASWAAIDFAGLRAYPQLLSRLTELVGPHSYSTYALARSLGASGGAAPAIGWAAAIVAILAASRLSDERRLLGAAIGVSLLATPILWPHYLVLLFVPIALARPRLSPLWAAPLLFWLDASAWSDASPARIATALALSAAIVAAALQRRSRAPGPIAPQPGPLVSTQRPQTEAFSL